MSKERARRRAERQAERERHRVARERRQARRERLERLRPQLPRRRRIARMWSRRTRAQRATIALAAAAVVVGAFWYVDSWPIRLAVVALVLIGTPALTTLALDRSRG